MLGRIVALGIVAVFTDVLIGAPSHAEIVNLSCDNGGMLLIFDTAHLTVTDTNPFQKTRVVAPLTATDKVFAWREGSGESAADYRMDRATGLVSATAHGAPVALSNPQCGRSAILMPKT